MPESSYGNLFRPARSAAAFRPRALTPTETFRFRLGERIPLSAIAASARANHLGKEVSIVIRLAGHFFADRDQDLKKFGTTVHLFVLRVRSDPELRIWAQIKQAFRIDQPKLDPIKPSDPAKYISVEKY